MLEAYPFRRVISMPSVVEEVTHSQEEQKGSNQRDGGRAWMIAGLHGVTG